VFRCGGTTYRLGRCDAFLIAPGGVVDYKADHEDPWSYAWVGFHGLKAEALLQEAGVSVRRPVFRTEDDGRLEALVRDMLSAADWKRGRDPMLLGLLYQFLAVLAVRPGIVREDPQGTRQEEYLQRALDYVAMNYAGPLSVADLARHAGLDRTYLYSLFMKHIGVSPKDHLLRFRVDRACTLLRTSLSVAEVARSVGYDDPQVFSRVFRRLKGIPPGRWRRETTDVGLKA
jgi:AraC-like DNA-binding protein